eukprot:TRINITY_DN78028_c0_g1_i1.p1 TRINITY_DN78028_c0_g1~~TRINITY_DN78028_c0_g1_i1.p1  ORF type:complete len:539 (+),score=44.24 TRINITY_DN78028_c0_g1_i1:54-1670(+)
MEASRNDIVSSDAVAPQNSELTSAAHRSDNAPAPVIIGAGADPGILEVNVKDDGVVDIDLEVGQEHVTEAQRLCVVCLSNPIDTAVLPCRHSTMCSNCVQEVRSAFGRCPVCKERMDYVLHGDFDADYFDVATFQTRWASKLWAAHEEYVSIAYGNMYCAFCAIFLGAGFGVPILYFIFLTEPNVNPSENGGGMTLLMVCAGIGALLFSLCVGYLPWFAATVKFFEEDELPGSERPRLFRAADLQRPCTLAVKVLLFTIALPFSIALFFIPYVFLILAVRPIANSAIPRAVRGCLCCCACWGLPLYSCSCIWIPESSRACCSATWRCIRQVIENAYRCALVPICSILAQCCTRCSELCQRCAKSVEECVLRFCWIPICRVLKAIFTPVCEALASLCAALGRCCEALASRCSACCSCVANTVRKLIVDPVMSAFRRMCDFVCIPAWNCLSAVANRILAFPARACSFILSRVQRCLGHVCTLFYLYALQPVRDFISPYLSRAAQCLRRAMQSPMAVIRAGCLWLRTIARDVLRSFRRRRS